MGTSHRVPDEVQLTVKSHAGVNVSSSSEHWWRTRETVGAEGRGKPTKEIIKLKGCNKNKKK